jgi:hypothetical protein
VIKVLVEGRIQPLKPKEKRLEKLVKFNIIIINKLNDCLWFCLKQIVVADNAGAKSICMRYCGVETQK